MPVTSALRNHLAAEGKLTAAACTRLPTRRLASPGMALGSKAMAEILSRSAAAMEGAQAREQRYVFERTHIDEAQIEAGLGHQSNLHAPRRAHKEHFSRVPLNQLVSHRQRRNDVASGAAARYEYAQIRHFSAFQREAP